MKMCMLATLVRSSCLTLLLTFSARLHVKLIMPDSCTASPSISCKFGLRKNTHHLIQHYPILSVQQHMLGVKIIHSPHPLQGEHLCFYVVLLPHESAQLHLHFRLSGKCVYIQFMPLHSQHPHNLTVQAHTHFF